MDPQEIAALTLVALAAGWLLARLWRQITGKKTDAGCPGCNECGHPSTAPKATPLITINSGSRSMRAKPGNKARE